MGWVMCILFSVVTVLIIIKLYIKLTTRWCRSNVCLVGKTVIVTGANTGIGYETAEDFAKRGSRVILACRNAIKGQEAVDNIIKATNNKNIVFKPLDLSSFKSIREFVTDINETEERLDILVNNAGAGGYDQAKSEDGLLLLMQINYFGPFLLTNLLLDLLKKTHNSRIVNVSSLMAKYAYNFVVKHLNLYPGELHVSDRSLYSRSKLCNILFTIELAERLRGTSVTTYSLHPGAIQTEIFRKRSPVQRFIIEQLLYWFFKNRMEGAQTTIYCSVAKGIESLSGEHFADCQFSSRYKTAQDRDLPKQLWKASEGLVKLTSK